MAQLSDFEALCKELKTVDASIKSLKDPVDRNLNWVESSVKKPDTQTIERYIGFAKKQIADSKGALEASEHGKRYLDIMTRYFDCVDGLLAYYKLKSEGENLASTCNKKMYWVNESLKKQDAKSVQKYWTELQALTAPLLAADKYHQFPDVAKYLNEYNQLSDSVEKLVGSILVSDEIKTKGSAITSKAHWVKTSLDKKDSAGATRYGDELRALFTPFVASYGSKEEAQKIIQETTALLDRLDKEVGGIVLDQECEKDASALKSKAHWVKTFLDKKSPDETMRYANELKELFVPFVEKYSSVSKAAAIIAEITEILNRVDKEVAPMAMENECQKAVSSIKSKAHWVKTGLDSKDPRATVKYSDELRELFTPFVEKFSQLETAKATIQEVSKLLERVDTEVTPMIAEEESEKIISQLKSQMNWLTTSLNNKDDTGALKYKQQIEPLARDLRTKYANHVPKAREFLTQVDALLNRVDTELGDIIASKEIALISKETSSYWLSQALEKKDPFQAQVYLPKVESTVESLQKYNKHPESVTIITKLQQLLDRANKEMGPMLAEHDIANFSEKISFPLKWLEESINKKDITNIVKYQERVLELTGPFKLKYSQNQKASAILTKVNNAIKRCQTELLDVLADAKVQKVEKSIKALLESKSSDSKAAAMKALTLAYPLRMRDVRHRATALLTSVDSFAKTANVSASEFQRKEIDKIIATLKPMDKTTITAVKEANKVALPLRKSFLWDDKVVEALKELDEANLDMFGRVPVEEEFVPIVEVNMKLPGNVQTALKAANQQGEIVNKKLSEAKRLYEGVNLSGDGLTVFHGVDTTNFFTDPFTAIEPLLNDAQKALDQVSQKVSSLSEPEVQLIKDSIEPTQKLIAEGLSLWKRKCAYAVKNANTQYFITMANKMKSAALGCQDNAKSMEISMVPSALHNKLPRSGFNVELSNAFSAIYIILDLAETNNNLAKSMEEDNAEAQSLANLLKNTRLEAKSAHGEFVRRMAENAVKTNDYDRFTRALQYVEVLKKHNPEDPAIKEVENRIEEIKNEAEMERKREEEERHKAQAEAHQRRVEIGKKLKEEWMDKYTGGEITVDGNVWKFSGKDLICTSGRFAGWKATYEPELDQGRLAVSFSANKPIPSIDVNLHENGIQAYYRGFQISNNTTIHTLYYIERSKIAQYDVSKAKVTGSVPIIITIIVTRLAESLKNIKPIVDSETIKMQIHVWKEERFKAIEKSVIKTCPVCRTAGSNIRWCPDCDGSYCTSHKCSSGSSNVCPRCKGHKGTSVPSSPAFLHDPTSTQYSKVKVNAPVWYNDL